MTCFGVSLPCPQEHVGEGYSGTFLLCRKAASPVLPDRSWIAMELFAFDRPLCSSSTPCPGSAVKCSPHGGFLDFQRALHRRTSYINKYLFFVPITLSSY